MMLALDSKSKDLTLYFSLTLYFYFSLYFSFPKIPGVVVLMLVTGETDLVPLDSKSKDLTLSA